MGLSKVDSADQLGPALLGALGFDDSVIIQQWVDGVEVSVTVLSDAEGEKTLPPV